MSEHTTHTPTVKRLERSSSDRVVAGVAGGLGRYFDLNPTFFRLGFVVLTLIGGAGVLIYLAALLVMPDEGRERSIAEDVLARRRERPWPLVGLGLAAVALAVLLSRATLWPAASFGWVLVLIAGLGILWAYDRRGGERSRPRRLGLWLLGVLVALIVAIVAAVAVAAAWFDVGLGDGVGTRVEAPANASELKSSYELGIGELRIDLSRIGPVTTETHVSAKVGIGTLGIIVPPDVSVAATAHAKAGEVYVLNNHDDGRNVSVSVGSGGPLVIDAKIGAGRINVVRAIR
jgi:phage shock protein PspC (stress-responsive transcriptional regulator)